MSPLDKIAPYPVDGRSVTAGDLIKHYVAFGEMHSHLADEFPDGPQWHQSLAHVVHAFTITFLLREVRKRLAEHVVDHIARELWLSWEDGALPPELWRWADEEGLSHAEIKAAADEVAAHIRAKASAASDRPAYVNGDDGYKWLTCEGCEALLMEVDAGTTLRELNEAHAAHRCAEAAQAQKGGDDA